MKLTLSVGPNPRVDVHGGARYHAAENGTDIGYHGG
jgi:hypothetical protein